MRGISSFLVLTALLMAVFLTGCPKKPVTVEFSADVTSGVMPLNVQFTDLSDPGSSAITAWQWLFGDDSAGAVEQNPSHTYIRDGVFTVTLTVQTADGGEVTSSKTAYITVTKMIPSITAWPTAHAITYGQALSASTLTGGAASVDGIFTFAIPATIPDAGIYSAAVIFTPADTANYGAVSGTVNVTVAKASPNVTAWPAASDIMYGQPLSASALSGGSASVSGTFAFSTPGVVLSAGTHTVAAIFLPADAQNYSAVSGTVDVTVDQATPTVTAWPATSAITYGQTLAASALTGGNATVAGKFSFNAPTTTPNAGTYSAAVTFTPTDATNYVPVSGMVNVTVNKATPSVTAWPTAGVLVRGQPLSSTTLTGGTASVAGMFAFTAPATIPSAGNYAAAVTFTPTDSANYTTVSGTVNVSVKVIAFVRPGGNGNGTAWGTAFGSIQSAVNSVSGAEGEVWVAAGTYKEPVTMKSGVNLYGGFAGTETTRDARNWETKKSIIDGQQKNRCVVGANNAVLDGFVIQNGLSEKGGGMYNDGAAPTVANCTFTKNSANNPTNPASRNGGGMYNRYCSPAVTNCIFTENSAKGTGDYGGGGGGGIYNYCSSPTITNCTFTGNTAGSNSIFGGNKGGGGMYNYLSSPTVSNCTFSGNTLVGYHDGGGIYNHGHSPSITNCTFTENSAPNGSGGAISNEDSSATVTGCYFEGNSADDVGGAIHGGKAKVTNCNFTGNIAAGSGGAICGSNLGVTNCLFADNSADYGGAIRSAWPGVSMITNCTLTLNTAIYGGGIYSGADSAPKITNCILWGNAATNTGNEIGKHRESGAITVTYSCIAGGWGGTGNISSNPLFVDEVNADCRLQSSSPCIDKGTSSGAPASDIIGVLRPQGAGFDMGAYEMTVP